MNTNKTIAEKIASEYEVKKTSKIVALKKLDAKAKLMPTIFTYTYGIISTLLFGAGFSFIIKVIGDGTMLYNVIGYILAILGLIGICTNYLIYTKILANSKKKYANDIVTLAKEIEEDESGK